MHSDVMRLTTAKEFFHLGVRPKLASLGPVDVIQGLVRNYFFVEKVIVFWFRDLECHMDFLLCKEAMSQRQNVV